MKALPHEWEGSKLKGNLNNQNKRGVPNYHRPHILQSNYSIIVGSVTYTDISNNEDADNYLETPVYYVLVTEDYDDKKNDEGKQN